MLEKAIVTFEESPSPKGPIAGVREEITRVLPRDSLRSSVHWRSCSRLTPMLGWLSKHLNLGVVEKGGCVHRLSGSHSVLSR